MKLLHQCGHNTTWNIESYRDDNCGDGLIFSPVHEKRGRMDKFPVSIRRVSVFDPQYYLPNSQKAKLHSYDFFPEVISSGFSTLNYTMVARKSAEKCISYQLEQEFDRLVIPARHFEQMHPDYTDKQEAYTVAPFLHELGRRKSKKKVSLTLPLTSHMIEDVSYRTAILNWVTKFSEISGLYIIVECERNTKQIASESFLDAMLLMLTEIKRAALDLVIGYTNTEALLYSLTGDVDVTFGAYENTRMFSIDKFLVNDEIRLGPKPRIYLPGLLNWVQFDQAAELRKSSKSLWKKVYEPTAWSEEVFEMAAEPHFSQPALYKHHFHCFSRQVSEPMSRKDRYTTVRGWVKNAINLYDEISEIPIDFERHGSNAHLQPWLNVINRYSASHLKT